jgi:hypothetical protein
MHYGQLLLLLLCKQGMEDANYACSWLSMTE